MNKKLLSVFFAVLLCVVVSVPAFADTAGDYTPHLIDNADLLTGEEESNLLAKLDEISDRLSVDVAVVTEDSIGDKTPREYADDFYDYNSYKYNPDGVLLLISMEERDWYITTTGSAITAITDARRGNMEDAFLSDLSGGYYYDAFSTYADMCDSYISGVQSGYYEEGEAYEESTVGNFPWGPAILVSLAIGLVAALVVTGFMRGQLKSVRRKAAASDYVRPGSMNVAYANDVFLYSHVNRTAKPKDNDSSGGSATHTSSSGTTHGGGGGKF